jgi:hypothetical protein
MRKLVLAAFAFLSSELVSASSLNQQKYASITSAPLRLAWVHKSDGTRQISLLHLGLRGGSTEEDEYNEEGSEEEYDSDEESDVEPETMSAADGVQIELKVEKYDEPLVASPMLNLYASLGVMLLGRRIDLFSPTVVRIARFLFIAYLVSLQAFVIYARFKAKELNDRTPLTVSSPLSSMLNAQLGSQGGMVKSLASSFLSSQSSVLEYDLQQTKSMQSGLLFNMLFMWFLHFKMNQVQPLFIQTMTGVASLIYSPLFQVYVMGRNLERPFKSPATKKFDEVAETLVENDAVAEGSTEAATPTEDAESTDSDASEDDDEVSTPRNEEDAKRVDDSETVESESDDDASAEDSDEEK